MPELPEVEVTRRGFAARIRGATVLGSRWGKPLRWPLGVEPALLVGQTILAVNRRGKYLLLHMDRGLLLLHLGMSGSLRFDTQLPAPGPHDHFGLLTTLGELRLHDPRRFGAVVYARDLDDPVAVKLLGKLGMEPLSGRFDSEAFIKGFRNTKTSVKQVLLGGQVVVGVGNIYACEALFMARIPPTKPAHTVGVKRLLSLQAAVVQLLQRAVEAGGTTLRDFSGADGRAGHFQAQTQVYGREGLPCVVCASPVQRVLQNQRSTYFCPRCQAR